MFIKYAIAKIDTVFPSYKDFNRFVKTAGLSDKTQNKILTKIASIPAIKADPDNFIYLRNRSISAFETWGFNQNYDGFPSKELQEKHKTFIQCPVDVDHINEDPERDVIGIVLDSTYIPKQLVVTGMAGGVEQIFPFSEELKDDMLAKGFKCKAIGDWVENLLAIDKKKAEKHTPGLPDAILTGEVSDTSMGTGVLKSECSVCGNIAEDENQFCDHIMYGKGKQFMHQGKMKLAGEINHGLGFFEDSVILSEVFAKKANKKAEAGGEGADFNAKILQVVAGKQRKPDGSILDYIKVANLPGYYVNQNNYLEVGEEPGDVKAEREKYEKDLQKFYDKKKDVKVGDKSLSFGFLRQAFVQDFDEFKNKFEVKSKADEIRLRMAHNKIANTEDVIGIIQALVKKNNKIDKDFINDKLESLGYHRSEIEDALSYLNNFKGMNLFKQSSKDEDYNYVNYKGYEIFVGDSNGILEARIYDSSSKLIGDMFRANSVSEGIEKAKNYIDSLSKTAYFAEDISVSQQKNVYDESMKDDKKNATEQIGSQALDSSQPGSLQQNIYSILKILGKTQQEKGGDIESKEHENTYNKIKEDAADGNLDTTLNDFGQMIAKDHLDEFDNYYKYLPKFEDELKKKDAKKLDVAEQSKDKKPKDDMVKYSEPQEENESWSQRLQAHFKKTFKNYWKDEQLTGQESKNQGIGLESYDNLLNKKEFDYKKKNGDPKYYGDHKDRKGEFKTDEFGKPISKKAGKSNLASDDEHSGMRNSDTVGGSNSTYKIPSGKDEKEHLAEYPLSGAVAKLLNTLGHVNPDADALMEERLEEKKKYKFENADTLKRTEHTKGNIENLKIALKKLADYGDSLPMPEAIDDSRPDYNPEHRYYDRQRGKSEETFTLEELKYLSDHSLFGIDIDLDKAIRGLGEDYKVTLQFDKEHKEGTVKTSPQSPDYKKIVKEKGKENVLEEDLLANYYIDAEKMLGKPFSDENNKPITKSPRLTFWDFPVEDKEYFNLEETIDSDIAEEVEMENKPINKHEDVDLSEIDLGYDKELIEDYVTELFDEGQSRASIYNTIKQKLPQVDINLIQTTVFNLYDKLKGEKASREKPKFEEGKEGVLKALADVTFNDMNQGANVKLYKKDSAGNPTSEQVDQGTVSTVAPQQGKDNKTYTDVNVNGKNYSTEDFVAVKQSKLADKKATLDKLESIVFDVPDLNKKGSLDKLESLFNDKKFKINISAKKSLDALDSLFDQPLQLKQLQPKVATFEGLDEGGFKLNGSPMSKGQVDPLSLINEDFFNY